MRAGIELIKSFEGCHKLRPDGRYEAYKCPAGVWTIGYGSTGPDIKQGTIWDENQVNARFAQDVVSFSEGVLKLSPGLKGQPTRLGAVVSFAYNVGLGAYQKSTMRKLIDAGDYAKAADEFGKWTKAGGKELPGLVKRRKAERDLFVI